MGFLDDSVIKNPPANAGGTRESVSIPGSGNQVEKEWQPIPIFLPGKFHGQRSLAVHGVAKSDTTERLSTNTHTYMVTDILSSWQTSPDSLVRRESHTTKKRKILLSLTKIHFIRATTDSHTGIYKLGGKNSFLLMGQNQGGIIWAGN